MLETTGEAHSSLARYAEVPIAFSASEIFEVVTGADGVRLNRCMVPAFVKDYDAQAETRPADRGARFEVGRRGIPAARLDGRRVGGAVIAWAGPGVDLLGSPDDALLWDLRVAPEVRGRSRRGALPGGGSPGRGARRLLVETQT